MLNSFLIRAFSTLDLGLGDSSCATGHPGRIHGSTAGRATDVPAALTCGLQETTLCIAHFGIIQGLSAVRLAKKPSVPAISCRLGMPVAARVAHDG
jgi:hypothetical protein